MKTFQENPHIGKTKHSVSFYDGIKKHGDGSPLSDLRIFRRRKDKDAFTNHLIAIGYFKR